MKKKKLKIWNGRGYGGRNDSIYIAAYSRSEAARLYCEGLRKVRNYNSNIDKRELGQAYREIRDYFCEGAWGNNMEGVEPEVGLWYVDEYPNKPIKII